MSKYEKQQIEKNTKIKNTYKKIKKSTSTEIVYNRVSLGTDIIELRRE